MREVTIALIVQSKIDDIELYLKNDLKMSKEAAKKRSDRMREHVRSFRVPIDYPLCRFKKWRAMGYRCAVFEKDWVFAYEIFEKGIIVRDICHTSLLTK